MIFRLLQIAVPFVWLGFVGGISFVEAPLKFQAPNITLPLGLGIGRLVFFALNKIEIALAILLLVSFFKIKPQARLPLIFFGAIAFLLVLQTVWLLPVLDKRAAEIITGQSVAPGSYEHLIYIAADAVKFILLSALGASIAKNSLKFESQFRN